MKLKNVKWLFVVLAMLLPLMLTSCMQKRMEKYYTKTENYIVVKGTVSHIKYSEDGTELYLGFEEMEPKCDDNSFKIVGKNLDIVKENGIDEKIHMGDRVSFMTAPEYFGDGYVMPIVGIAVDGETLLEFSDGYGHFIEWLTK